MPQGNYRIRERRKELGLSQLELAVRAEVSSRTVQFAEAGNQDVKHTTLELIASALGLTFDEIVKGNEQDAFQKWPWSLSRFFKHQILPCESAVCKTQADAEWAIAEMRKSWRLHLERSDSQSDQIFGTADQMLDERYTAYETRYLSLWKRNPLTILFACAEGKRTGVSVVLPVSDTAYQALREGRISFMEITDDDILEESQNLILDSGVEFANQPSKSWYQVTDSLTFSIFYQMAILSCNPTRQDFRMLSFGASPVNLERLGTIGFIECDVEMPEFGYPLCELVGNNGDLSQNSNEKSVVSTHFAQLLKYCVPENIHLRTNRRVMILALRAYQKLAKRFSLVSDSESKDNAA